MSATSAQKHGLPSITSPIAMVLTAVLAAALLLSFSAHAEAQTETGTQCSRTTLETVTTDQESYVPGSTVYISGGGYAVGCDVEIRITRPDGVIETATVSTYFGSEISHEYILPPPPGVLGTYLLEAVGLDGEVLASHLFTDGPEINNPDVVMGADLGGGLRRFSVLVRNTGDTDHKCINLTLPSGYTDISVVDRVASQGSFATGISGQVITATNSTGITKKQSNGTVVGWARFEINAKPNSTPGDWVLQASNQTGCGGSTTSLISVRVVPAPPAERRYTAQFVDGSGNAISPSVGSATSGTYRLRMTKLPDSQSNKISYFGVAVPTCFTGVTVTHAGTNGASAWEASALGNFIRWNKVSSGELDDNNSVTVTFTANSGGCVGGQVFGSGGWQDSPGSTGGDDTKVFSTVSVPTITVSSDTTAPTVTSINRVGSSPTNTTSPVSWTVTFSESVDGVNAADFALANTGLGGTPAITGVTGSGTTRTVTASSGTGSGTLGLNLVDDDSIVDAAANKLGGAGTGNGNFTGQVFTIDRTAPVIAASAVTLPDEAAYTAGTWTNKSVRVTFACTDAGGSGKATDTASATTNLTAETTVSGTTVNSGGSCTDNAGNTAAATSFGPVKIDKSAPTIADLGPTSAPNSAGWYLADVTNRFRATDSLSGLNAACLTSFPDVSGTRVQSKTTTGEGLAVTVNSDACTDVAGNAAAPATSAAFKVDKTAPSISDLGPTTDPNGAGWYKADVTNGFKATDSLSGLGEACETAFPDVSGERVQSKTTSGEGASVTVSSDACTDVAGNTAAAVISDEFKVDTTSPTISDLGPTTAPNDDGWYNANVTNRFAAEDSLSGLDDACETAFPATDDGRVQSKTTSGEGAAVTVSSDACTDEAGNTADAIDSAAFKVDKSTPSSVADSPSATNNSPFTVSYTAGDQEDLSGLVKVELYVRTPEAGTDYQLAATDSSPAGSDAFNYTPDGGEGTYRFYTVAYDAAGNREASPVTYDTVTDIEVGVPDDTTNYDITAPVTNDDADSVWHNEAVTVTLSPSDTGGSGVDKTFYKVDDATEFTEGSSVLIAAPADHSNDGTHTITYYSTDLAGNQESDKTATVKIDTTAPSITDLGPTTDPNANGWYKADVVNEFAAVDGGSGLDAACLTAFPNVDGERVQSKTTSGQGTALTVTSDPCTDSAGNTATAVTSAEFKVDKAAPSISDLGPTAQPNDAGWYKTDVTNRFKAADSLSGLDADCLTAFPDVAGERVQSKVTNGQGTAVKVSSSSCTDDAGNTAVAVNSADFKVDKTAPTITDLGPTTAANGNGWYNANVTNEFVAEDSLSGLGEACETAFPDVSGERVQSKTTSGEGASVTVSSDACTDTAGNTAFALTSAAFKIDKSAPSISDLGPTTDPNGSGWYNANVTNEFKAEDSLSGLDEACETAFPATDGGRVQTKTTSGEGSAITVTSDTCTDKAGNTTAAIGSASFKIDKSAPTSEADSPTETNDSPFTVTYSANDQADLSGLTKVELYVRTPASGTGYVLADTDTTPEATRSFSYTPVAGEGTYRFYTVAYDSAGNRETSPVTYDTETSIETGTPDSTTLYDTTAPVTTDDADSAWQNSAVTVALSPSDTGGSGVDKTFYKIDGAASYTEGTSVHIAAPADHSNDGTHTITYYSTDLAGNQESDKTATVKIDTTNPVIVRDAAADSCSLPGDDGWCRGTQTAGFTATDGGSGLATDGAASRSFTKTSSTDATAAQVASGTVTDRAGNTAVSINAGPFKIDGTDPTVTCQAAPTFIVGATGANVSATVTDATSGPDASPVSSAANTSTPGERTVGVTGSDQAGNTDTVSCSYKVQYGWNGFRQPINDTAHQTGLTQSRFKMGSTIPAKFIITNALGQSVQQTPLPTFKRTNRLRACDSNATSEPTPADLSPDGDGTYNSDGTQYHYNWSTKGIKQTGVYRIYANLADGTERWVDICLW